MIDRFTLLSYFALGDTVVWNLPDGTTVTGPMCRIEHEDGSGLSFNVTVRCDRSQALVNVYVRCPR